jgi:hypothetical protein
MNKIYGAIGVLVLLLVIGYGFRAEWNEREESFKIPSIPKETCLDKNKETHMKRTEEELKQYKRAYFAGGCVRDMLLGTQPKDFDIATSATPDQVEEIFEKTVPIGKSFGVILVIQNGHHYEIATFRSESEYADGRRPTKIEFTTAQQDALRRDFVLVLGAVATRRGTRNAGNSAPRSNRFWLIAPGAKQ